MNVLSHGTFSITQCDDIAYIKFKDAINLDLYSEYLHEIAQVAKGYNGERWAEIHDYLEWGLAPREVFDRVKCYCQNEEDLKFRCTDQVVITNNIVVKKIVEKLTQDPIFLTPKFVKSVQEAYTYLHNLGYRGKPPCPEE